MISAIGWIRREAAAVQPTKYQLSESDYATFMSQANEQIKKTHKEAKDKGIDLKGELESGKKNKKKNDKSMEVVSVEAEAEADGIKSESDEDDLSKYNLDEYDENNENSSDDDEVEGEDSYNDNDQNGGMTDAIFMPLNKLMQTDKSDDQIFNEEDLDDLTIRPTDLLLVIAKTEDEISQLEIHVYEEEVVGESGGIEDNLYVHHDLMLPSFPLCLEWINCKIGSDSLANYVAVGTFEPQVEIWNLDTLDLVYPTLTLGSGSQDHKYYNPALNHQEAVMCLAWNSKCNNFLASGGADNKILLWDMAGAGGSNRVDNALRSFNHHTGKVQSLQWNPQQSTVLLSGSYDQTARVFDVRSPESTLTFTGLKGDVEQVKWRDENIFAVSDESGRVSFFDVRQNSAPISVIDAHGKAVTCLDFSPLVNPRTNQSIFLTASTDKSVKIWSIDATSTNFNCLLSKEMAVGKIFASAFLPDAPLILSAGGNRGNLNMWNLKKEETIVSFFQ